MESEGPLFASTRVGVPLSRGFFTGLISHFQVSKVIKQEASFVLSKLPVCIQHDDAR